jgi:hypothetical protein
MELYTLEVYLAFEILGLIESQFLAAYTIRHLSVVCLMDGLRRGRMVGLDTFCLDVSALLRPVAVTNRGLHFFTFSAGASQPSSPSNAWFYIKALCAGQYVSTVSHWFACLCSSGSPTEGPRITGSATCSACSVSCCGWMWDSCGVLSWRRCPRRDVGVSPSLFLWVGGLRRLRLSRSVNSVQSKR